MQTLMSSVFNTSVAEYFLNVLTLGSYKDMSNLLVPVENQSATIIAWGLAIAKWVLLAFAVFLLWKAVCDRFNFKLIVPVAITAATIIAIMLVYNTPWNDAGTMSNRISAFSNAFTDEPVNYTPSVMIYAINLTKIPVDFLESGVNTTVNAIPSNITAPTIQGGKIPTITSTTYDTSWFRWLVVIAVALIVSYILARVSAVLSAVVLATIALTVIGVNGDTIACAILEVALAILAVVLARHSETRFLIPYPVAAMILVAAYVLQPQKSVLMTMLMSAFVISLFPLFYSLGIVLYGIGELIEGREKFGMKIKPQKIIEEFAGRYDPLMVGVVLTALFVGVIILFDISISGFGVFATTSIALLRS